MCSFKTCIHIALFPGALYAAIHATNSLQIHMLISQRILFDLVAVINFICTLLNIN